MPRRLERLTRLGRVAELVVIVLAICVMPWTVEQGFAQGEGSALAALELKFSIAVEEAELPIGTLAEKYGKALAGHLKELQKSGDLEKVLLVRGEVERFEKERSPAADLSELDSLSRLQKIYAEQHDLAIEASEERLDTLKMAYRRELGALVRKLTVDGEIDEAIKVRGVIEQVGKVAISSKPSWEEGMVLHLGFDAAEGETVPDLSGSGNHGIIRGDTMLEESLEGRGRFISLDGDGDYIKCVHDESLVLTTDCTIALWLRPDELRDLRGLVSKYNPNNSYVLRTSGNSEKGFRVIFGDLGNNRRAETPLEVGDWVHIAVTLSDHNVVFYLNGVLDSEGLRSKQVPLATSADSVKIGSDVNSRFFKGDIDEVRIFRRALSAAEIAKIYKSESK